MKIFFTALFCSLISIAANAQFTNVGSGSYTKTFPGVDAANRNSFPSGSPQISGNALGNPVPTNDWWSALIKEDHVSNLFNYPMTMKTVSNGLVVSYIVPTPTPNGSSQPIDDYLPITVGVSELNASKATVSDYSDWTVTMNWSNSNHQFEATSGIGMPFLYFTKGSSDIAQIEITKGSVTVHGEMITVTDAHQGADFAIYGPSGSTWAKNGNFYTSSLNGKNYWSMAMLPQSLSNISSVAENYKKYAYVFPVNTTTEWSYDETNSKLTSTFTVIPDVKEGFQTNVLQGLLPHQWDYLAPNSPQPEAYSYNSIRGEIKTLDGNTFTIQNTFKGILPTLPYLNNNSEGFNPAALDEKIEQIQNDPLATWTDSYNEGQMMNRLIQTARIADEMGDVIARDKMVATVKERLEDWLKAESGEKAFLFYYNTTWSALIGYPAGHGQDNNLNDHHFHWGYFIHAAAFMEQYEPGWADEWGDMINLLVRDAASPDRNDSDFPFLRNFSPYAGHSWANGFATFPFGNDQESTSESMQFASSLIHWGAITENDEVRDLGIYIYTTEQTAIEEYWLDINKRTFKPEYGFSLASRIWGNGYDNQTFWTSDIAAAYGIEIYPIHGGSLYLGHHKAYAESLWAEMASNTGILSNDENANLWHDTYWKYLAFTNPQAAIDLYNSNPNRNLKFGISDAQTYHWLHAMNVLGSVNASVTSDYPIAACFEKEGSKTYVAHNYKDVPLTVVFSDGFELRVEARDMATSKDVSGSVSLSSNLSEIDENGSVLLTAETNETEVSKIEFYNGNTLIGSDVSAPYNMEVSNLASGMQSLYAKMYLGNAFTTSNVVSVQVGNQSSFLTPTSQIPGTIEAGHYDKFQGGKCQNITYLDLSQENQGDYRPDESVDAFSDAQQGAAVGWISSGEWMEYTVYVTTSGVYNLNFNYACGNSGGGGPFHLENNGTRISSDISMPYTGAWDSWRAKEVNQIALNQGTQVIRIAIDGGEFNLGEMVFTLAEPNSGTNNAPIVSMSSPNSGSVVLLGSTQTLSASASDNGGSITLVEFFDGAVKIGEDSTPPYQINWQPAVIKTYSIKAIATDNENNKSTSSSISIIVNDENTCTVTSVEAEQGTFSEGYSVSFETIENDVIVAFELLDSDKDGVVGYLWNELPFSEAPMNRVYGTKFSATLANQTAGATLSYACKFAYAGGGISVTKYFTYEVGTEFCVAPCDNEVNKPNSQTLHLPSGWSIFSTYIVPTDPEIRKVLEPLILNNQITIVKDNTGNAYLPEWNFNAIGNISPKEGYLIKTTNTCTLELSGNYAVPEEHSITLPKGWNTIGYLPTVAEDAELVLSELIVADNLVIAKDFNGNALLPEWGFNGIGDMKPGEGYQLKVKDASSITYEYKDACNNVD
jgi:endo-1,3(4)-beta-glucanase